MRVVLQPETEQVVLNWSKLTLITLILEKLIGLLWLKFVTTYFLRITWCLIWVAGWEWEGFGNCWMGKYGNGIWVSDGNGMGTGMKSLKWEGIGTKNLFPHASSSYFVTIIFGWLGQLKLSCLQCTRTVAVVTWLSLTERRVNSILPYLLSRYIYNTAWSFSVINAAWPVWSYCSHNIPVVRNWFVSFLCSYNVRQSQDNLCLLIILNF